MKRVLITFGGAAYDSITEQVVRDAPGFGVDEVRVYDDVWLDAHEFRYFNSWLWEHEGTHPNAPKGRGYGWYSWKPLIIQETLDTLEKGDAVLYVDADTRPIADLSPIFKTTEQDGAMFFRASAHSNHRWCTRDAVFCMGLDPKWRKAKRAPATSEVLMAPAGCARFMAFQKGPWRPRQLLAEWLAYAINPMCTTFEPSVLGPEHPEFEEHRTEQAILTLLCHKYGYLLYREADQDGVGYEGQPEQPGDYPQLFEQKHMGGPHPRGVGSRFRDV